MFCVLPFFVCVVFCAVICVCVGCSSFVVRAALFVVCCMLVVVVCVLFVVRCLIYSNCYVVFLAC